MGMWAAGFAVRNGCQEQPKFAADWETGPTEKKGVLPCVFGGHPYRRSSCHRRCLRQITRSRLQPPSTSCWGGPPAQTTWRRLQEGLLRFGTAEEYQVALRLRTEGCEKAVRVTKASGTPRSRRGC